MSFKLDTMCVGAPSDSREGERHIELVREDIDSDNVENLYNITTTWEDYVNPIADGELS